MQLLYALILGFKRNQSVKFKKKKRKSLSKNSYVVAYWVLQKNFYPEE